MPEDDLYKEWASGVSLANANSNEYFEEIATELNKPAEFQVKPEQIPDAPTTPPAPVQVTPEPVVPQEPELQTRPGKHGGLISLGKTSKGWKATLESGESNIPSENFYGVNKDDLIFEVLDGKLEASKAIRRLKKEKLLGGDERTPAAPSTYSPVSPTPIITTPTLSADDIVDLKQKINDNPAEGIEAYLTKKFGKNADQLAAALNAAEEAKAIVAAQAAKADIEDVNREFIRENQDFAQHYANNSENVNKLIARMAKVYLGKRISSNSPQAVIDNTIYDLFTRGVWTVENLETAKEELIDGGLLEKTTTVSPSPTPSPEPVVTHQSAPSAAEAPRIATQDGQQPVGLGIPARNSNPVSVPEEKPLSGVDLEKLSMNDLRKVAMAQLQQMKTQQQ